MILIDCYEPKTYQEKILNLTDAFVDQLDVGDYSFKTGDDRLVIIERKTPSDLVSSLSNGRLQDQLLRIREKTDLGFLLIDGSFKASSRGFVLTSNRNSSWRVSQVLNTLITIQLEGIYINTTSDTNQFPEYIVSMFNYFQKDKHTSLVKPKGDNNGEQVAVRVLMAVPAIGYERAQALIAQFGTLEGVFTATREQLMSVAKMSDKSVESILKLRG